MKKFSFQMFLELIPKLVNHALANLIAFSKPLFWEGDAVELSMPTEALWKLNIKRVKNDIYGHDEEHK